METISFKLPTIITQPKSYNYTTFTELTTNVYKFDNVELDKTNNFILLYNNALKIKNEPNNKQQAYNLFKECKNLIELNIDKYLDKDNNILYDVYINLALLASELNHSETEVSDNYEHTIFLFPDRSEPYYYWAIYCNKIRQHKKALELLLKAYAISYEDAKNKYPTTQIRAYGKFLYDEMSVAYYWLDNFKKSKQLIETIINDPDFHSCRERIQKNLDFCNEKLGIINI